MDKKTVTNIYHTHIDGLKGLLCLLIMLGHFWNIYRGCSGISPLSTPILDTLNSSFLSKTLFLATFWLYAFLVISGYLLSQTHIRSKKELLYKITKRFFRFYLPILGACIFIFILQKTIGFHAHETYTYFTNTWFQKYYKSPFVIKDIFTETWHALSSSSCKFNQPFWVISDMFLSSIMIYLCNFLDYLYQKKTHLLLLIFILTAILLDRHVIIACLAGYCVGYYEESFKRLQNKITAYIIISSSLIWCFYMLTSQKVLPQTFDKIACYILLYCLVLLLLNHCTFMQSIFSSKLLLNLNKISFGIYSFHWPIICSVGSLLLIYGLECKWNPLIIYVLSYIGSLLGTIIISIFYHQIVELPIDKLLQFRKH